EVHAGRVPMDRLRAIAPAIDALLADVPQGVSDQPPLAYEPDAYTDVYRQMDARGGLHLFVVLHAGEQVAAVSEATWYGDASQAANQQFTGVARAFRGRGVGLAIKSRMLQLVRDKVPDARDVFTNNAVDNTPMLRINARLGFQGVRQSAVFQLRRDALARQLGAIG
ncbi:MAG TPA: N-acetyltransferase, partial [Ramlibacter sp.]